MDKNMLISNTSRYKTFSIITVVTIATQIIVCSSQTGSSGATTGNGNQNSCVPECLNGGGCVDGYCVCSQPWRGEQCTLLPQNIRNTTRYGPVTPNDYACDGVVCRNGGSCFGSSSYSAYTYEDYIYGDYYNEGNIGALEFDSSPCECFWPWTGQSCEIHVCQQCEEHGHCTRNNFQQTVCLCEQGYAGQLCDISCADFCTAGRYTNCTETQPNTDDIICDCLEGYSGQRCELNHNVELLGVYPSYGPVAGGTNVTLKGIEMAQVDQVELIPECGSNCSQFNVILHDRSRIQYGWSRSDVIYLNTLNSAPYGFDATSPNIERLRYIIVLKSLTLNQRWLTRFHFEYRPNPTVLGITPRRTFISGGIRLTTVGTNLDSVAEPLFRVFVEERISDGIREFTQQYAPLETVAEVYNGTLLYCFTPVIDLSTLDPQGPTSFPGNPARKRRRRRDAGLVNNATYDFYVAYAFDGFEYRNPDREASRLSVYGNPSLDPFDGTESFDPDDDKHITIRGTELTIGAGIEDYTVTIGDAFCDVTDLTDNRLTCEPPDKEPDVVKEGSFKSGKPRVVVNCGFGRYDIGHIDYIEDINLLYIIIGVALGVLLLIIIVVLVAYCVCKDKSKKGGGPEGAAGERGGGASPYDSRPAANREVDASDGYPFETTPAFPQIKR